MKKIIIFIYGVLLISLYNFIYCYGMILRGGDMFVPLNQQNIIIILICLIVIVSEFLYRILKNKT